MANKPAFHTSSLLSCLMPQKPPEPVNAKIIRLGIGSASEPITPESKRKRAREYYHRNAERLRKEQADRDRGKKADRRAPRRDL